MQIILIIAVLIFNFVGNLSNDVFLVALPSIGSAFQVSIKLMKQSYSIWFLGATLGQIPAAILMKIFNRRKIAFIAALIFLAASAICATATSLTTLVIGRLLQGLCFAVCNVYTLLEVQESFSAPAQQKIYSINAVFNNISPLVGPIIGGWLLSRFGWQYNFYFIIFMLIIASLALARSLQYKEGLTQSEIAVGEQIKTFLTSYKVVFSNPNILISLAGPGLSISCGVAYLMSAPYIFTRDYNISIEKFGFYQAFIMFGYLVGVFTSLYIIPLDVVRRLKYGSLIILAVGFAILGSRKLGIEELNQYLVLIWIAQFGLGYSYNALIINAMSKISDTSAAASILGMMSAFFCVMYTSVLCQLNFDKFSEIASVMVINSVLIIWISKVNENSQATSVKI